MNVYIVDIDRFTPDEASVSPYRLEKARHFKHATGQLLSLAASKALDLALSEFGLRERDMLYVDGTNGKPVFRNCPLQFSLSHSGHYACAAVSPSPVGLDLQMASKYDPRVANRCFSADEISALHAASDKDASFTRLWVQHESAVKLTGEGLSGMKAADLSRYAFCFHELSDAFICVCTGQPCEVSFICL